MRRLANLEKTTLVLLGVATGLLVAYTPLVSDNRANTRVINLAGRQCMLPHKLVNDSLLAAVEGEDPADIADIVARFEKVHIGLSEGDDELGLPPGVASKADLRTVWLAWETLLAIASRNDKPFDDWIHDMHREGRNVQEEMDKVVMALDRRYATQQRLSDKVVAMMVSVAAVTCAMFVFMVFRMVRHRESLDDELADGGAQTAAILESVVDGVISVDETGKIVWVNAAVEGIFGWSPDEIVGQNIITIMSPGYADAHAERFRQLESGEGSIIDMRREAEARHRDGRVFPVDMTVTEAKVSGRRTFVGVFRDITERKRAEAELRAAKVAAEAANLAKSAFLANMSHEIRTPLTAILGHTELLETDGDMRRAPKSRMDALRAIRRNGDHLLEVVSDILDLSKIEAGKMRIDLEPCDPAAIVTDVADALRPRLETDVSLSIRAGGAPKCILSSRKALRQIMLNIIGNAVKFTPTGEISVEISQSAGDLIFDVSDTGEGMADISCLFQAFHQLDSSRERRHEGTGLGLAISKRLAQCLGGDVTVTRTGPEGSTFRVTLPNNKCEESPTVERGLAGLRILLAEDSEDNRAMISEFLRRAGARVTSVVDGSVALEQVAMQEFDVIVMDMRMPVMDGWHATRMLRDAGFDTPVIALTSPGDALIDVCDAHLPKPVSAASLISTIQGCLSRAEQIA